MHPDEFCKSYLRCPQCHHPFEPGRCEQCGAQFQETLGIWDLRHPANTSVDSRDSPIVQELVKRYDTLSFQALADFLRRNRFQDYTEDVLDHMQARSKDSYDLGQQRTTMFQDRLFQHFTLPDTRVALDLGCGYGTTSVPLAQQFTSVVSIDIDLSVLILARKYLEEQNITNATLLQAAAQNLPLRGESVDYVMAHNVIEHLFDVKPALQEIQRILSPGGCFCGDSRNRYDLVFPEPHVRVRWVGLMPRKFQSSYVWWRKGVDYADMHARLLSWWELRRYARAVFGRSMRIVLPSASAYGQSARVDQWLSRLERQPGLRTAIMWFFPSHMLLAQASKRSNRTKVRDPS